MVFKITHPFHPHRGIDLEVVSYYHVASEKRVFYTAPDSVIYSVPITWTSFNAKDPYVVLSEKRSLFRVDELLLLHELLFELDKDVRENRP